MKSTSVITVVAGITLSLLAGMGNAQGMRISSDGHIGCTSREYFKKLVRYAGDNDKDAFKQGLVAGMLTGECTAFKDGELVYTTDTALFSGLVKIRRKGSTTEYWTNIETVK